jgi:hypothetical protein
LLFGPEKSTQAQTDALEDQDSMKQENHSASSREPGKPGVEASQHLSTGGLAIVLGGLAIALVAGYLLLNKLIDISQEEDCALAHRYNCGAVEVPR